MKKSQLITKQQLEIETFKSREKENKKIKKDLHGMFYAIGSPLNDNNLQFNKEQLTWCSNVYNIIEEIR